MSATCMLVNSVARDNTASSVDLSQFKDTETGLVARGLAELRCDFYQMILAACWSKMIWLPT